MPGGFKNKKVRPDLSRPVADLNVTGVTREWRHVKVQNLQEDDIVSGMGKVRMSVLETCDGQITVCAGYPEDKFYFIDIDTDVFAFVEKGN